MSKALHSPTARILRSSRLFALPPPLPQPLVEQATPSGFIRTSDTATLPYPTRQAITAPASSLHRGDWGLKRPLPEKTTKTSTPHVRLNALDTLEHITDFSSAADHTRTLAKWQEMDILMVQRDRHGRDSNSNASAKSAFDGRYDRTAIPDYAPETRAEKADSWAINDEGCTTRRAERLKQYAATPALAKIKRWRTNGPWLPHMSETEFEEFVRKVVEEPRTKTEFEAFLKSIRTVTKRNRAKQVMQDEDRSFDPKNPEDVERVERESVVTPEDFEEFVLKLREDFATAGSPLGVIVQQFFDMEAAPLLASNNMKSMAVDQLEADRESAPPSTHPSAGLSYKRNDAHMDNHPAYGPQTDHAPVLSRVLRPRESALGSINRAQLGVGGIVARDTNSASYAPQKGEDTPVAATNNFDFDHAGGARIWVETERAYVSEAGLIQLIVKNAAQEARAVKTGAPDPRFAGADDQDGKDFMEKSKLANVAVAVDDLAMPQYERVEPARGFDRAELQSLKRDIKEGKKERMGNALVNLLRDQEEAKARAR